MHEVPVDAEGTELEPGVVESDRRLVCQPDRVDVALLVHGNVRRSRGLRIGQGRHLGDGSWNALPHLVGVEIESRLEIRRELVADIAAHAVARAEAVIAEAVRDLRRCGDETIPWPVGAPCIGLQSPEAEGSHVERDAIRKSVASRCRHEVDGASQRIGSELQRIPALVHLDVFVGGRVDLLEIAVAVGRVDRDAVHIKLHATQMEIARQAGSANRKPGIVAPFRLRKHAGHVVQDILDRAGRSRIPVGLRCDQRYAARRLVDLAQRLLGGENRQGTGAGAPFGSCRRLCRRSCRRAGPR